MIYTSGVVTDENKEETLEELQDNKLALVCHKLDLKAEDRLLDIGSGWGTLTTYAAKNFGCDATGVTLAREQTKFGTEGIAQNGYAIPMFPMYYCADILCIVFQPIVLESSAWMPTIFPITPLAATPRSHRLNKQNISESDDTKAS